MFTKTRNIIKSFLYNQSRRAILDSILMESDFNRLIVKGALINNKTFKEFKNSCCGKKVVICGAGPSLKFYKPIKDAIHIALNRSILFDKVHFDYLFVQDFTGVTWNKLEKYVIEYPNCIKFFEQEGYFTAINKMCCNESFMNLCKNARPFYTDYLISSLNNCDFRKNIKFTKDIDSELLGSFPYVGLTVLQFALFLNPSDLYLVGYDCVGSHFTFKNLDKESIKREQNFGFESYVDQYFFCWNKFKKFALNYYPLTKIHSINPVKLKNIFDDIYQK